MQVQRSRLHEMGKKCNAQARFSVNGILRKAAYFKALAFGAPPRLADCPRGRRFVASLAASAIPSAFATRSTVASSGLPAR
jgi:hypothetical protein